MFDRRKQQQPGVDLEEAGSNWRGKVMVVGGILGALVGVGGAYLLIQNAERHGKQLTMNAGDSMKLGLLLMGVMRQVAQLGDDS